MRPEVIKEVLTERRKRQEQISAILSKEIKEVKEHIAQATLTDDQLSAIGDFYAKIMDRLQGADFDPKPHIIEQLDVHCKMDFQNHEKVV